MMFSPVVFVLVALGVDPRLFRCCGLGTDLALLPLVSVDRVMTANHQLDIMYCFAQEGTNLPLVAFCTVRSMLSLVHSSIAQ